jgi:4-amino-4-deoxy-L-arabinose transferase-like glycosyltransferase
MYYAIGFYDATFEAWLRLPPFGIWLQAVSMLIFGINGFAARFPSALASLLTAIAVYFMGRSSFSRRSGFFASLVFLTTPWVHAGFNAGRDGGLDTLLVLFGSLFVYTAWLAVKRDEPRWLYLMGVFAGLAVLTKGFGAGVFLIVILPVVLFNQQIFLKREFLRSVAITLLLTLPWPIYAYSLYGETFIREAFVRYIIDRAAGNAFGANTNAVFDFMDYPYIKSILFDPGMFYPWVFILILIIPVILYRRLASDTQSSLDPDFLIWWTLVSFGLFVFIGEKQWYVMPMYVPAAILVGRVIESAANGQRTEITCLAAGIVIALAVSPDLSIGRELTILLNGWTVLIFGVIMVTWARPLQQWLTPRIPSWLNTALSGFAPFIITIILIAALVGAPSATDRNAGQHALAVELNEHASTDALVFIESRMNRAFHTFSFYAQRPLISGPVSELAPSSAPYAVLRTDSLGDVGPETTVLMNATLAEGQEVSLVRTQNE